MSMSIMALRLHACMDDAELQITLREPGFIALHSPESPVMALPVPLLPQSTD